MKIFLLLLSLVFGLIGASEFMTLNEHDVVAYSFPCLILAAIFLIGFAIVDALGRVIAILEKGIQK